MDDAQKNSSVADSLILTVPFKVTSADTDMNSRIRLGALVNLLIQSAVSSADSLEAGFGGLREQKLFWVLSRITIEINQAVTWYQTGEIETWPKDVKKILYLRDFIVSGSEHELIAKATSGWLAVDLDTKSPRTVQGGQSSFFDKLKDKHAMSSAPEKLFPVRDGEVSEVKTTYFDIDVNGHVTSSRYIDWMMDTFPVDFHQHHYPVKISINYLNETRLGENIQLKKNTADGRMFVFEGFNKDRNLVSFRGKIAF
jgi:medium-chain acyl-[acyl-carrier-protein] hydrolase